VPPKLAPSAPEPEMMQVLMIDCDTELPILIPFDVELSMAQV